MVDGEERGDLTEVRKEMMEVLDLDKNEISAEAVESIRKELEEKGKSSMLGSLENNDDSYTSEDPEELKEFLWGVCWKRGWLKGWWDSRQEGYNRVEWAMGRNFVLDYEITQCHVFQIDWL